MKIKFWESLALLLALVVYQATEPNLEIQVAVGIAIGCFILSQLIDCD